MREYINENLLLLLVIYLVGILIGIFFFVPWQLAHEKIKKPEAEFQIILSFIWPAVFIVTVIYHLYQKCCLQPCIWIFNSMVKLYTPIKQAPPISPEIDYSKSNYRNIKFKKDSNNEIIN